MHTRYFELNRPLPADVAAGEAALIQFYQKYAVFSWPWAWRRTVLFGAFIALGGISFGVTHGMYVKVAWEGAAVAAISGLANVTCVAFGPVLAALVRRQRLAQPLEGILVVVAVFGGMLLAVFANWLASDFHDYLMAAHGFHGATPGEAAPPPDAHEWVEQAINGSYEMFVLFVASGGLALATYFTEPRRWAEHGRRVELEQANLQKSESHMRLTLLQAQVEPHFLFNTLASLRSLINTEPQRAAQTIDALAQYLRATLPKLRAETGLTSSTLGEQFAICASYLELMKIRLGARLSVEIRLPAELRSAPFPPLLLISLVENAITHGVEPKRGEARVMLTARLIQQQPHSAVEVRVEDDGAGLKLGMGEGTGIANVREQLRTRFGAAASFELSARDGGGVLARLVVPLEA
jgi:hypothetical protein